MNYRIRPSERFSAEFKATGKEQLEDAIDILTTRPEGLLEAIHSARKNFKKVRALYGLVATDIPDVRRKENDRIRHMARSLSSFRDATALVETSRYLQQHSENDDERVALERVTRILSQRCEEQTAGRTAIEESIVATVTDCGEALDALAEVSFDDGAKRDAARVRKGWRKALKRAHLARQACENTTDARRFHELRKRGQDYRQYLHLLQDLWPSAMVAKRNAASEMIDLLGHHNDLALLASLVNEQPHLFGRNEDIAYLLSAIIARQEALRWAALKLADTIFLDPPGKEADRVALLWKEAA